MPRFQLRDVKVRVRDTGSTVVKGVTLEAEKPGVYVIMGPNGAGKSSLANAVMGHAAYELEGNIILDDRDVTSLPTHEKARAGLTLAAQNPEELEGVRVAEILNKVIARFRGVKDPAEANRLAAQLLEAVGLPRSMLGRYYMVGMSGGERKRLELARVLAQKPKVAFLDEPDSGVDVESIPLIAKAIEMLRDEGAIVYLITHQPRLLEYLTPDRVYVMYGGRVAAEGGPELVKLIEEKGYTWLATRG